MLKHKLIPFALLALSQSIFAQQAPTAGNQLQQIPPSPVPNISSGTVPVPNNVNVLTLGNSFKRPYVQSWNLVLEKNICLGFTASAGYVATRTVGQTGAAVDIGHVRFQAVGRGRFIPELAMAAAGPSRRSNSTARKSTKARTLADRWRRLGYTA